MQTSDFDFDLPEALIAQYPPAERGGSRLLHLAAEGALQDGRFADLPGWLSPGDLMVFNDTRVVKARLFGRKASGGKLEVVVERVLEEGGVLAHVRASHAPKPGARFYLTEDELEVEVLERRDSLFLLRFAPGVDVWAVMERSGSLPLPPYITRSAEGDDSERYQTVYARERGAVAAPTAGLHFDTTMLATLQAQGVDLAQVTLHVGAGTFQPVRVEQIAEHRMHRERYTVPEATVAAVARTRGRGGRVLAVGTTSLRALEAAAQGGDLVAGSGDTDIFITPGYRFRVVERLLTNFHLPRSTLLMLVSAFAGVGAVRAAYRHAIAERYRFFSYGDAMLIERAV